MIALTANEFESIREYHNFKDYELDVRKDQSLTLQEIEKAIQDEFLLPPDWRLEKSHRPKYRIPRQLAHWFGFKCTRIPYSTVTGYFGGKDRTVIYHSLKKIDEFIDNKDPEFYDSIINVRNKLKP